MTSNGNEYECWRWRTDGTFDCGCQQRKRDSQQQARKNREESEEEEEVKSPMSCPTSGEESSLRRISEANGLIG